MGKKTLTSTGGMYSGFRSMCCRKKYQTRIKQKMMGEGKAVLVNSSFITKSLPFSSNTAYMI